MKTREELTWGHSPRSFKGLALAGLLALGLLLVSPVSPARAGKIYKYRDSNGQTHFVDDLRKIPTKYRDQVEKRPARSTRPAAPAAEEAGEGQGEEGAAAGGSGEKSGVAPKEGVDLTGLPPDIDPATVVGRDPETGRFLLDPGRPERLKAEQERAEELNKQQKLGQADKDGHDRAWWRQRIASCRAEAKNLREQHKAASAAYVGSQKFGMPEEARRVEELNERAKAKEAECARIPEDARAAGAPVGWVR
ncbi:MAG: DUF4124 domain-containing protein [Chrysiogenetes bacterium]|nr:DUF4124 domain-containing protein [Chrysiogenetes bacterium]